MPETQWMTLTETADMMKRLPDQVTQMCEDGKLEYYMEDGRYFVSRESIDLFMHPPIGQPAPANPDTNGTPRRQYGRAPHGIEPLAESAPDSQPVISPDEVDADGGLKTEDSMEETPGRGEESAETADGTQLAEDRAAEDEESAADALSEVEAQPAVDRVDAEDARPVEDPAVADYLSASKDLETSEDRVDAEDARPVEDPVVAEHDETDEEMVETPEEEQHVEAEADPGEPDVRVAEILADLRAALSRHAREHKAFCDEIAGLADALESTLSRDDDKTSELTREISSLLARYTRR